MFFSMSEIMSEIIAFGFESIIVLVLNFPACSASLDNFSHVFSGDSMIRSKGIFENYFPIRITGCKFTPIDLKRILASS